MEAYEHKTSEKIAIGAMVIGILLFLAGVAWLDYPSSEGHGAAAILKIVAGLILFAAGRLSLSWQQARTNVKTSSDDVATSRKDYGMPRIVFAVVLVVAGGSIGFFFGVLVYVGLAMSGFIHGDIDTFPAGGIGTAFGAIGLPLAVDILDQRAKRRQRGAKSNEHN